jgi:hypothetical protein
MRESSKLGAREHRQLAHPQRVVGLLGQACKDVVLGEAQVDLAPQLNAEDIGQRRDDAVEYPPRLEFVGGELPPAVFRIQAAPLPPSTRSRTKR